MRFMSRLFQLIMLAMMFCFIATPIWAAEGASAGDNSVWLSIFKAIVLPIVLPIIAYFVAKYLKPLINNAQAEEYKKIVRAIINQFRSLYPDSELLGIIDQIVATVAQGLGVPYEQAYRMTMDGLADVGIVFEGNKTIMVHAAKDAKTKLGLNY